MTTTEHFSNKPFVNKNSKFAEKESQSSNFYLNQNSKCPILIPVQTFTKSNNDIFGDSGNSEEKANSQLWNKATTDSKHSTKNSTLPLHISTYENSVKAESDTFGNKINESHKLKINEQQNAKQIFAASKFVIQNPFEFSRQQSDKKSKPEVSQFKASQRLLNPNKAQNNVHPMTLRSRKKNNEEELQVEVKISVNSASKISKTKKPVKNDGIKNTGSAKSESFAAKKSSNVTDPFDEDSEIIEHDPYANFEAAIFREDDDETPSKTSCQDNSKVQSKILKQQPQPPKQIASRNYPPLSSKARNEQSCISESLSLGNQSRSNESAVSASTTTTTSSACPSGFAKGAKQMLADRYLAEGNIINNMLKNVCKKAKDDKREKKC